jgi:hypothetical protein
VKGGTMRSRKLRGGLVVALVLALGSCAGTQVSRDLDRLKHDEIGNLWIQIRQWRSEAKLQLDPPASMMQFVRGTSVSELKAKTCPANHPVPTTCNDICSVADNICDNAERICELAAELGKNDDYAQQKCTSAKASCREAKQKCCGCAEKTADALGDGGATW